MCTYVIVSTKSHIVWASVNDRSARCTGYDAKSWHCSSILGTRAQRRMSRPIDTALGNHEYFISKKSMDLNHGYYLCLTASAEFIRGFLSHFGFLVALGRFAIFDKKKKKEKKTIFFCLR